MIKPVPADDLRKAIINSCANQEPSFATARGARGVSPALSKTDFPLRILVAEDNPVNQDLAAIEYCEKEDYDVVFMDLQMPGMDGLTATQEIRRRPKLAMNRIYAMTAHAMTGDREKCLETSMDGYLSKPLQMNELRSVLKKIEQEVAASLVS